MVEMAVQLVPLVVQVVEAMVPMEAMVEMEEMEEMEQLVEMELLLVRGVTVMRLAVVVVVPMRCSNPEAQVEMGKW